MTAISDSCPEGRIPPEYEDGAHAAAFGGAALTAAQVVNNAERGVEPASNSTQVQREEEARPDAVATAWAPLIALPRAREDGKGGYFVSCPTDRHQHGDRSAGLHVTIDESGIVLVHCFAGCDTRDVLREVGCTPKDLYPDTPERRQAQARAARAIAAPPDPHLVALRNAEYQACLDGWMAASRVVAEALVDSAARRQCGRVKVVI